MEFRKVLLGLSLLAVSLSRPLHADDLTLALDGYSSEDGYVMIAVYNDKDSYDSDTESIINIRHAPTLDGHRITFFDLPSGEYAVKAFHDENGNGDLDKNLLGLPKESYAFSGESDGIGPASFDSAKVKLSGTLTINLEFR